MKKNVKQSKPPEKHRAASVTGGTQTGGSARRLYSAQARLRVLVFCAGVVLLGLEIAGSRVLAPHFGNSVFVWGSLISIFLMALAAGYYLGGKLADKHPSQWLVNAVCIGVAAWIFGVTGAGHNVCAAVTGLGDRWGPFAAATILFLPPSLGLGIVSPLAVRISATTIESVGQVTGTLYALSTAGNIVGAVATTFILIPEVGLGAILRLLGFVMLVSAIATLPNFKSSVGQGMAFFAVLVALCGAFMKESKAIELQPGEEMVLERTTPYHHVMVIDGVSEVPGVASTNGVNVRSRQLRFDQYPETVIGLDKPYRTLGEYTNYFNLAWLVRPEMRRVLFIGAGGGVGPRAFADRDANMRIDVVDIDARVLEIAKDWFFLKESETLQLFAEDGRSFLRNAEKDGAEKYDCIVLDAFTIGGRIPFHLVTRECFELCSSRLTDDGVLVTNMSNSLDGPVSKIYRSMHRTLAEVFPNVYVFAAGRRKLNPGQTTNIVLVATRKERIEASQWATWAQGYRRDAFLNADDLLRMAQDLVPEATVDTEATVFTDDYAPIETMPF